jgi:phage terminase large subunit
MWSKMRDWLGSGAVIPDHSDLRKDLLAPGYEFDHSGRLKIESKEDLKKRGLKSTDLADALALTFAYPVAAPDLRRARPKFAEMD